MRKAIVLATDKNYLEKVLGQSSQSLFIIEMLISIYSIKEMFPLSGFAQLIIIFPD